MDNRSSTYLTVAAVTLAAGVAAYAVYFDYKRRNDAEFRKKLKKEKKRVQKVVAETKQSEASSSTTSGVTPASLREAIQQIRTEEGPRTPQEQEQFFMTQVAIGEKLAGEGPQSYLPAAMAFFRALRVYPAPVELIVIYEKTIIEPVFKLIMDLTSLDVKYRIEAYYDFFPPKRMNVSVEVRETTQGQGARQVLVASKDFAAGEVIYKEFPVVTALDADLQTKGTYCGQCLRPIEPEMSLQMPKDTSTSAFHLTYCSKACMLASKKQSQSLLFTLDPPLPPEIPSALPPPVAQEARREAQAKFAEYIKKSGKSSPLLVARFIARQVAGETQKLAQATSPSANSSAAEGDFTDAEEQAEKYVLADHLERLRYLEVVPNKEETELLAKVLQTALPGLEEFITPEKYATFTGKMAYNAFGVCFGGGRDDKVHISSLSRSIIPWLTPAISPNLLARPLTVSSYLTHSCQPSARPSFSSGTAEISIIANRDLKKGDVLTIAFVDVVQHADESVIECRRRRRIELARGWRFSCGCERCIEEGKTMSLEEKGGASDEQKDESKVEDSVKNYAVGHVASQAQEPGNTID
ncbi:hypothetical protein BDZ97DRAFT_1915330 [Flammula alnicola]|nr:hypothetical protein BDZ97DRAFT_1915330 [Flammula alnicola]